MHPFFCECVDVHACGCACMSVSLYVYVSPGRLCAAIAGVDYSTWPDGFGLGTTGWGYVSPLCPRRQLTLIILSANGRLNLLPLSLLIICIHVSHPKNSKVTKWGYYSFLQRFFYFDRHMSIVIMKQWAMTAHQVQTGTFRKITEQLQMVMTVTHPVSLCLFHPQSLLNPSSFFPPSCLVNDIDN